MMHPGNYPSKEDFDRRKAWSIARSRNKVDRLTKRLIDTIESSRVSEGEKMRMKQQVVEVITGSIKP